MRLAIIGYGTIARQALNVLARDLARPLDAIVCLARADGAGRAQDLLESLGAGLAGERLVVGTVSELLSHRPDFVAEAAGHKALQDYGAPILAAGKHLLVTSAGALADDDLRAGLDAAAQQSGARYRICPGAVGGLDILAAAKLSGLQDVLYTSRKPPKAWAGTPAERLVDLAALKAAHVFYEGSAGAAARDYPQNANVAATIALLGAGFAATRVRLIADPAVSRNVHELSVRSSCADFDIRISGQPSPENPKTSLTTGYALANQILDLWPHSRGA
ncbi:aspartate dehydrogenase [Roseiarcaceae bacterium H3SJ34-1]|uniref:aspartate dehydrogenase n=1 Tax=Terripilifer ovatus TaxID=3032367 RepID=UPI003AB93FBA|nr:aspartate dehydrogenase [Roseiarcaceae bacterium H3SJ34-1]